MGFSVNISKILNSINSSFKGKRISRLYLVIIGSKSGCLMIDPRLKGLKSILDRFLFVLYKYFSILSYRSVLQKPDLLESQ